MFSQEHLGREKTPKFFPVGSFVCVLQMNVFIKLPLFQETIPNKFLFAPIQILYVVIKKFS